MRMRTDSTYVAMFAGWEILWRLFGVCFYNGLRLLLGDAMLQQKSADAIRVAVTNFSAHGRSRRSND